MQYLGHRASEWLARSKKRASLILFDGLPKCVQIGKILHHVVLYIHGIIDNLTSLAPQLIDDGPSSRSLPQVEIGSIATYVSLIRINISEKRRWCESIL